VLPVDDDPIVRRVTMLLPNDLGVHRLQWKRLEDDKGIEFSDRFDGSP